MDSGAGPDRGSWHYVYANNSNVGHADNSSSGWAAIGMIPAERNWGATVPNFVKRENLISLEKMQQIGAGAGADCGTIGYANRGCAWGCAATTPNGMVLLEMDGKGPNQSIVWDRNDNGVYDAATESWNPYDQAAGWLGRNWGSGPSETDGNKVLGYTYGLFAAVKALRIAGVTTLTPATGANCPATLDASQAFDWYNDPTRGVAAVAISRQNADGSWPAAGGAGQTGLATQWYTIMLASALFQQGPQAVAAVNPSTVAPAQLVTFSHAGSYHLDAAKVIVTYEWDLDGNGTFEYSTNDINARPTTTYPSLVGPFPKMVVATLRVTDNNNPALNDTAQVTVTIDIVNVPPVAAITQIGGSLAVNTPINLSGATSSDPNAGPPPVGLHDSIVEYAWDLDDSNGLNTFATLGVAQTVQFATTGIHQVALRVRDTFGLTGTTFFTLDIPINRPPVAIALPDGAFAECTSPQGGSVTLDGSSSSDPDGDVLTYAWTAANGETIDSPTAAMTSATGAVGVHNFTLTVRDPLGATATNGASFTVADTVAPAIECSADVTEQCTSPAGASAHTSAHATDACDTSLDVTDDSLPLYPFGPTTVIYTANDGFKTNFCASIVTVIDDRPPSLTLNGDANQTLECRDAYTELGASASDVCDSNVPVVISGTVNTTAVGPNTLVYSAEDDHGNSATQSRTVNVVDTTAPTVICAGGQSECIGPSGTPVATTGSIADVCDPAVVLSDDALPAYPVGTTMVTYSGTDAAGHASSCVAQATVVDSIPPEVTCPPDAAPSADASCRGESNANATADDVCDPNVTVTDNGLGAAFPLGATSVTFTATDAAGLTDSCAQVVTVTDRSPPSPICAASVTVDTDAGVCNAAVALAAATASDNCDSNPAIAGGHPAAFELGTTTVSYTATDAAGNHADCSTTVAVVDHEAPMIHCPVLAAVYSDPALCGTAVDTDPQVEDNCDGTIAVTSSDADGFFPVGTTVVTLTATDDAGNSASCQTTVTVIDSTDPIPSCPAPRTVSAPSDRCGVEVAIDPATGTDNCDSGLTVTAIRSDDGGLADAYPVGTTQVTYYLEDDAGNVETCETSVTVLDVTAPAISCPASITTTADAATCRKTLPLAATATDACVQVTVVDNADKDAGLGTTAYTFTATDGSANSSQCISTITLTDNTAPLLTTKAGPELWPPNHKYQRIGVSDCVGSITDACNGQALDPVTIDDVFIVKATSDELEDDKLNGADGDKPPYKRGDGNTLNDIVFVDAQHVDLRAERLGGHDGRVYTLTLTVRDQAGNTTPGICKVTVPHDQGNGSAAIDGPVKYTVVR